ncbi:MAG TPA: transposase [Candidatus Acidoferrales bacterium]|nr:transposase [Candidatus Acidoferrales bacterium]
MLGGFAFLPRAALLPKLISGELRVKDAGRFLRSSAPSPSVHPLEGYDYSQPGAYFVTIVTEDRACLFGEVADGEMRSNEAGRMVAAEWEMLQERFTDVELDAFVVMPNHVHGIIVIATPPPVGAGLVPAHDRATARVALSVGDVVGAFKSRVTVEYTRGAKTSGWPPFRGHVWQRNYFEHIIRNEESLNRIRQYILDNPTRWAMDRENPAAVQPEAEDAWRI